MRRLLQLSLALVLTFISASLFSQTQTITGKIIDSKTGSPLADVSVKVKSSRKGTITNKDGAFSLVAAATDKLEISYVGYKTQTIAIGTR